MAIPNQCLSPLFFFSLSGLFSFRFEESQKSFYFFLLNTNYTDRQFQ